MKQNRKAQIRMAETIAVIFIFFVIILFGIVFYYKYSEITAKQEREELVEAKATQIILKTLFLPEVICSRGEAEPLLTCFDLMKVRAAKNVMEDKFGEYYFNLFPYVTITLTEVYPTEKEWVLYDKPKPESKNKDVSHFIVTLKDEMRSSKEGIFSFGYLTVEVYS